MKKLMNEKGQHTFSLFDLNAVHKMINQKISLSCSEILNFGKTPTDTVGNTVGFSRLKDMPC